MISKAEARKRGRDYRATLTIGESERLSEFIQVRAQRELDWPMCQRAHLFLPILRQHEVNTRPLLEWIWESHPHIATYVPRLANRTMEAVQVTQETALVHSELGVPEPTSGEVATAQTQFDLILIPLLAFDPAGQRVGYGGGYYDRFLATQKQAYKVGLAYAGTRVVEGIERELHDVRLDKVITG